MAEVSIRDAKVQLSKLIEQVLGGEEVTITRQKKPVAKLIPFTDAVQAEEARQRLIASIESGAAVGAGQGRFDRAEIYAERKG